MDSVGEGEGGKIWENDIETCKQWQTLLLGAPQSLQKVTAAMKLKDACPVEGNYDQPI